MSGYRDLYLEGREDVQTLVKVFPELQAHLVDSKGRDGVLKQLVRNAEGIGIIDRDFLAPEEVEALCSRYGQRLAVLGRFCTESYLLEPAYLLEFAERFAITSAPALRSEAAIRELLLQKGQLLCPYAAVNETLVKAAELMQYRKLTSQFKKYPVMTETEIRQELTGRFDRLPVREDLNCIVTRWETRSKELLGECTDLAGVHLRIDGKVLLQKVIYQEIRDVDPARFSSFQPEQLVEELAVIAREEPPAELVAILRKIKMLP